MKSLPAKNRRSDGKIERGHAQAVRNIYTPEDLSDNDFERDINFPGQFPYTRGIHPAGYRSKLWTIRQTAGFGSGEESNGRLKYLFEQGQTGLSVAFDLPTLMGYDSDHRLAEGEVGKCGTAVSSVEDMQLLFDGIPMESVTTALTINGPASITFAMYIVAAERQGCDISKLAGTLQNDILKEFIAQKEWIYPPRPSMRLVTDTLSFCAERMPKWNPISISGYHIREAGATALQELAFTLRDGIEYVEYGIRAGLDVDDFAQRLSFFWSSHSNFFEEIAKFRAARRIWARVMRDRFGAKDHGSLLMRFHTQTAGSTLTGQQPLNNVVRVAIQALAGVLGGAQSLHADGYDEALSLPGELAALLGIRTQQIIAHETGVINTIDPVGGSYFLEKLTDEMEAGANRYFRKIDEMGGMVAAIDRGFPQAEIAESAYQDQKSIELKERTVVGVNDFQIKKEQSIPTQIFDDSISQRQIERLRSMRFRRDNGAHGRALDALRKGAASAENTMPLLVECARENCTLGEMCDALKDVFGIYQEPAF